MLNNVVSNNAIYFENKNCNIFLEKLLHYSNLNMKYIIHIDGFDIPYLYDCFPRIVALGSKNLLQCHTTDSAFEKLKSFQKNAKNTIFGMLGYNLKNDIEDLTSTKETTIRFPDLFFIEPEIIFYFDKNGFYLDNFSNFKNENLLIDITNQTIPMEVNIESKIIYKEPKNNYFDSLNYLKSKITRGDIYEANYCVENIIETNLNPVEFYLKLTKNNPMPFSSFVKIDNKYILCASPERFLKNTDNHIVSQPIKGTAKRGNSEQEDIEIIQFLQDSEKERAENTMIVDLVRNDMSHTAKDGSVVVEELCKVYTFKNVHQMISTITSTKSKNFDYIETIKHCFPMGSMTGAPKINAMQCIDFIEHTNRGIFSGCVGYITPNGDFDFNVIIRTLLYDNEKKIASYHVGSAITIDSDNESEYIECGIKSSAIEKILFDNN